MSNIRLGINTGNLVQDNQTGVGHRTLKIINELSKKDINLYIYGTIPNDDKYSKNIHYCPYNTKSRFWRLYENHFNIGFRAYRDDLDILHCPKSILPFWSPQINTITIHDLIFLKYPETYSFGWKLYWKSLLNFSISKANHIIAVSNSTKKDIVDYFDVEPDKIHVIPGGIDLSVFSPESKKIDDRIHSQYEIPKRYFLYLGHFFRRKNLTTLLESYAPLVKNDQLPELVLAGPSEEGTNHVKKRIKELGIESYVHLPGYIDAQLLPSVYRNASGFIYPSLAEGFGFPILEAMACGCPVACSDVEALREIGQDTVNYFDPRSKESIRESILELAEENSSANPPDYLQNYDWDEIGNKYINFFHSIHN